MSNEVCKFARLGWTTGEYGDEYRVCICDKQKVMIFVDDGDSLESASEGLCKDCEDNEK